MINNYAPLLVKHILNVQLYHNTFVTNKNVPGRLVLNELVYVTKRRLCVVTRFSQSVKIGLSDDVNDET